MTAAARLSIADIKALLLQRLDGLVRELVPGAVLKGGVWTARSPLRVDRNAGSFAVWRAGRGAGAWKDFATDEKGDVIDLIAFCRCGASGSASAEQRKEAIRWAKSWLGLAAQDAQALGRAREKALRAQSDAEAAQVEAQKRKRRRAFEIYCAGKPLRGSLGEKYLRAARGIDLDLVTFDDAPRFHARLDHWTERGFYAPAIVFPMRRRDIGFAALHAIWLAPDGLGKAAGVNPKLTLGAMTGAAMRLHRAPGEAATTLLIVEGPEDALSGAAARPDWDCWAVAGLSNLGAQDLSDARIADVVIGADNDWAKPAAMAAFDKALGRLRAFRKPLSVARAHRGKDLNDLAREVG